MVTHTTHSTADSTDRLGTGLLTAEDNGKGVETSPGGRADNSADEDLLGSLESSIRILERPADGRTGNNAVEMDILQRSSLE
jgi:hypothetical protein